MSHEDKAREIVHGFFGEDAEKVDAFSGGTWLVDAITTALQEAAGEWYRIDDPEHPAPKDADVLLGGCQNGPPISIGRWGAVGRIRKNQRYGWADGPVEIDNPTHWRPLPPPPSNKDSTQ